MKTTKNNQHKKNNFKLIITLFLFAITIGSARAQSPDFNVGVKLGASLSTLRTGLDAVTDKSGSVGFNAGVFARVGNRLYFQPEVNYATFSNKYSFDTKNYNPKFQFINVPLMVGYKIVEQGSFDFRVSAGPDLYYDLKKPLAPSGFDYKKFTAGGLVDAGVDIGSLTLDARYSLGLNDVNKNLGQKVNIFSLAIGFKFQ